MPYTSPDPKDIQDVLHHKTIAVVGLSDKTYRASYGVAVYLQRAGYKIYPVNPTLTEVLGEKAYPDLAALPETVDIVNVFRRSEEVAGIADAAIEHGAKALWLQLGVVDKEAAARAQEAGLTVIMDKCIKIEHARNR